MGSGQTSNRGFPAPGGPSSQAGRRGYSDKARATKSAYGGPPINGRDSSYQGCHTRAVQYPVRGTCGAPHSRANAGGGTLGPQHLEQTPQAGGAGVAGALVPYRGVPTHASSSRVPGRETVSDPNVGEASWQELEEELAESTRLAASAASHYARKLVAAARAEAQAQLEASAASWAEQAHQMKALICDLTAKMNESHEHAQALEDELTDLTRARSERGSTAFSLRGFNPDELTVAAGRAHQAIAHFAEELDKVLVQKFGEVPLQSSVPVADNQHVLTGIAAGALFLDFEAEGFEREGASCFPETEETEAAEAREKETLRGPDPEVYRGSLHGTPFDDYCAARLERVSEAASRRLQLSCAAEAEAVFADRHVQLGWEVAAAETWRLQRMAHFCSPPPRIIRRTKGMPIDQFCNPGPGSGSGPVLFMLMPGFRAGGVLVSKCQVYPVPPQEWSEAEGTPRSVLQALKQPSARTPEPESRLPGDPVTKWSAVVVGSTAAVFGPAKMPPHDAP